ncbi:hypothetical protein [Clostridium sp. Marseille-P3244]|uniref:hypothetical protein n=1 Tax=Clostridium sp. Marseille-P3244 TaxID=1871020 RepID=UPI000931CB79|nr:hypothetical protein [Clostridium sp. Marseille-P3244]
MSQTTIKSMRSTALKSFTGGRDRGSAAVFDKTYPLNMLRTMRPIFPEGKKYTETRANSIEILQKMTGTKSLANY